MSPLETMFSLVLTHWTMDIATSRTLLPGWQDGSEPRIDRPRSRL